jgi:hypothetical protein
MFTYKGIPCGAHPDAIVAEAFGGDGSKTVWQDLGMSDAERLVAIAEFETHQARQLRSNEYPPIGDQLDALWKGGDAAAEMLAKVQAVKAKYPKPTE